MSTETGKICLFQGWIPDFLSNTSSLETIPTQTAKMESSSFIYVFVDTYALYWLGQIKFIKVNQRNLIAIQNKEISIWQLNVWECIGGRKKGGEQLT